MKIPEGRPSNMAADPDVVYYALLDTSVRDRRGRLIRPWVVVVIDATTHRVLTSRVTTHRPDADELKAVRKVAGASVT